MCACAPIHITVYRARVLFRPEREFEWGGGQPREWSHRTRMLGRIPTLPVPLTFILFTPSPLNNILLVYWPTSSTSFHATLHARLPCINANPGSHLIQINTSLLCPGHGGPFALATARGGAQPDTRVGLRRWIAHRVCLSIVMHVSWRYMFYRQINEISTQMYIAVHDAYEHETHYVDHFCIFAFLIT